MLGIYKINKSSYVIQIKRTEWEPRDCLQYLWAFVSVRCADTPVLMIFAWLWEFALLCLPPLWITWSPRCLAKRWKKVLDDGWAALLLISWRRPLELCSRICLNEASKSVGVCMWFKVAAGNMEIWVCFSCSASHIRDVWMSGRRCDSSQVPAAIFRLTLVYFVWAESIRWVWKWN